MHRLSFLGFLLLIASAATCEKDCDDFAPDATYNDVCAILAADALDIDCSASLDFEGDRIGVVGKLNPDFTDYLNDYAADFPDTWPSFFYVIDASLNEDDALGTSEVLNEKTIQIVLANDGVNASSFEPLKEELETLFANQAYRTIKVRGIAREFNQTTNTNCRKGIYLEIDKLEDVVLE